MGIIYIMLVVSLLLAIFFLLSFMWANSTLFMFVFGIGTLPDFIFLGALKSTFAKLTFFNKRVVLASLVSIVGVFMVLRGMNLGIPYISPKMEIVMAKHNKDNPQGTQENLKMEAKMSCCSESKETDCSE